MKKFILDLTVTENIRLNANYVLLKLTSQSLLPEMLPGQFAEIRVDGSPTPFTFYEFIGTTCIIATVKTAK